MHSARFLRQLALTLSVASVAQASWLELKMFDRSEDGLPALKRQTTGESSGAPTTPVPTPTDSTTTPTDETTTDSPTTTTDPTTTSQAPTTTGFTTTSNDPTAPTTTDPSTTNNNPGTTSQQPTTTQEPVTQTLTTTWTSTDSNGVATTGSATSTAVTTPTADSQNQGAGEDNGKMPQETQNIIIGCTVGIGGAIIVAAAAFLFWRLRNKKRSAHSDEPLSYGAGFGGPGTAEKSDTTGSPVGRTPFQDTLDSYHAPTSTNAASNF